MVPKEFNSALKEWLEAPSGTEFKGSPVTLVFGLSLEEIAKARGVDFEVETIQFTATQTKLSEDVIERCFPEIQHDQAMQDRVVEQLQQHLTSEMVKVFGFTKIP